MTMLKVCCIASLEEAQMAMDAGANAIGLVGPMPSGPGVIEDATIAEIAKFVGDKVWSVLLTSRVSVEGICDHVAETGVNTVQIVDEPEPGTYRALRQMASAPRIIQVIHVEDESAIALAQKSAQEVDVILLDSGRPSAPTKILGGTGQQHDWRLSRAIVEAVPCPVFLAGGIRPNNVTDAIRQVRPAGIDLCTGVRQDGALSEELLAALRDAINTADQDG